MIARLPLAFFLLIVAALDFADRSHDRALPIAAFVIGLGLIATVLLDEHWLDRRPPPSAP